MKAWLMALIASRRPQPVAVPFNKNGTLVVPAGVSSVSLVGNGARGQDASGFLGYEQTIYFNARRRSDGGIDSAQGPTTYHAGTPPDSYCGPFLSSPSDPTYSEIQTCYAFVAANVSNPPTTGASATALGKVFPGSYGNTTPPITSFSNVPVTGGASYNIVVPAGGLVTVTYYL